MSWRLLVDGPASGAWNMAVDEALVRAVGAGEAPPTLRFFAWEPACLSLGRFQRFAAEVDEAACQAAGVDVVRRPTGGRLLLHEREVTYSVVAPEDHPLVAGSVVAAYARISGALLAGLARLGVEAELAGRARRGDAARTRFGACFDSPSDYEIVAGGRKLVGSAQWRPGGAVLQHGAVVLATDAARFYRCALPPPGVTRADAAAHLQARIIGLEDLADRALALETVVAALAAGFEAAGLSLAPGRLTPAELALAERLRAEKYATSTWTRDRIAPAANSDEPL